MFEAIIAFLIAHSSFFSFLFGGGAAGGGTYYYFNKKSEEDEVRHEAERQEKDRANDVLKQENSEFLQQCQELTEENGQLKQRLQVKQIEATQYKVLYRSLVEILQRGQAKDLSTDEISEIMQKALKGFIESYMNEHEENMSVFLVDPITKDLFDNPVVLPSGYTLNASTVNEIYRTQRQPRCPITRMELPLDPHTLPQNRAVIDLVNFLKEMELDIWVRQMLNPEQSSEPLVSASNEPPRDVSRMPLRRRRTQTDDITDGTESVVSSSHSSTSNPETSWFTGFYQRVVGGNISSSPEEQASVAVPQGFDSSQISTGYGIS